MTSRRLFVNLHTPDTSVATGSALDCVRVAKNNFVPIKLGNDAKVREVRLLMYTIEFHPAVSTVVLPTSQFLFVECRFNSLSQSRADYLTIDKTNFNSAITALPITISSASTIMPNLTAPIVLIKSPDDNGIKLETFELCFYVDDSTKLSLGANAPEIKKCALWFEIIV